MIRCGKTDRDVQARRGERGQALPETALFSLLAILLAFGTLALIPVHRARTTATAAAYACAQFASQSPNPARAAYQAALVAEKTVEADWSGAFGADYQVQVLSPAGPGTAAGCVVSYRPPALFSGLLGLETKWSQVAFYGHSEAWKARWR